MVDQDEKQLSRRGLLTGRFPKSKLSTNNEKSPENHPFITSESSRHNLAEKRRQSSLSRREMLTLLKNSLAALAASLIRSSLVGQTAEQLSTTPTETNPRLLPEESTLEGTGSQEVERKSISIDMSNYVHEGDGSEHSPFHLNFSQLFADYPQLKGHSEIVDSSGDYFRLHNTDLELDFSGLQGKAIDLTETAHYTTLRIPNKPADEYQNMTNFSQHFVGLKIESQNSSTSIIGDKDTPVRFLCSRDGRQLASAFFIESYDDSSSANDAVFWGIEIVDVPAYFSDEELGAETAAPTGITIINGNVSVQQSIIKSVKDESDKNPALQQLSRGIVGFCDYQDQEILIDVQGTLVNVYWDGINANGNARIHIYSSQLIQEQRQRGAAVSITQASKFVDRAIEIQDSIISYTKGIVIFYDEMVELLSAQVEFKNSTIDCGMWGISEDALIEDSTVLLTPQTKSISMDIAENGNTLIVKWGYYSTSVDNITNLSDIRSLRIELLEERERSPISFAKFIPTFSADNELEVTTASIPDFSMVFIDRLTQKEIPLTKELLQQSLADNWTQIAAETNETYDRLILFYDPLRTQVGYYFAYSRFMDNDFLQEAVVYWID